MDERTVGQLNTLPFATYCHSAAPGFALEGDVSALAQLLGVAAEEIAGADFAQLIDPESGEQLMQKRAMLLEEGNVELFLPLRAANGEIRWFLDRGRVVTKDGKSWAEGVLVEMDATYHRICAERKQMEQYREKLSQTETMVSSLRVRAEQDSLTRLLNARTTRELAEDYLATREKACAMIVIDVDNFKRINDTYGHMVGDQAMIGAAATIKKFFRANDVVGRIGGDEFLVLMRDVARQEIVDMRCEQIVQGFHQIEFGQHPGDTMSCTVGAVFTETPGLDYDALFGFADRAMYKAKSAGKGRFYVEVLGQTAL